MQVQVRGSVPLLWSQPPDIWPFSLQAKVVARMEAHSGPFTLFADALLRQYGAATLLHMPSKHLQVGVGRLRS
jgi:hypothetical protein